MTSAASGWSCTAASAILENRGLARERVVDPAGRVVVAEIARKGLPRRRSDVDLGKADLHGAYRPRHTFHAVRAMAGALCSSIENQLR